MYLKKAISGHMVKRKLFPVTWKKPSNNHMIKLSAVKEIRSVPCPERATRKRFSPPSLSETVTRNMCFLILCIRNSNQEYVFPDSLSKKH